jgi:hypothetical protein
MNQLKWRPACLPRLSGKPGRGIQLPRVWYSEYLGRVWHHAVVYLARVLPSVLVTAPESRRYKGGFFRVAAVSGAV